MDKSTHIPGAKEYTAAAVTTDSFKEQALLVMDRVTGELYDPKAKFDELMNKPEIMASLNRLKIR